MSRISQNFFLAPNYQSNIKMLLYLLILSCVRTKKIINKFKTYWWIHFTTVSILVAIFITFMFSATHHMTSALHFPTTNWMKAIQNLLDSRKYRGLDFSRVTAWQCYSNIRIVWMDAKYTQKFVKVTLSVLILHPKWLEFHGVKLCQPPYLWLKIKIIS